MLDRHERYVRPGAALVDHALPPEQPDLLRALVAGLLDRAERAR
jgi:hypothetical protein